MSPASASLSFDAEQLLSALERRAGEGGQAGAASWLRALVAERRDVAGKVAAGGDLDALLSAAGEGVGSPELSRAEIEERASRRAADQGRALIATADIAGAILDAQAAPAEKAEAPAEEEQPPARGRIPTFRLFVSSTFQDLEQERNALREKVYPKLRELCTKRGARFQPIDLRWGVSEEASLDQQAINICIGEIDRCREVTPRPNFLVLLGNRYGWVPPPPQIPAAEFDRILAQVEGDEDRDLLEEWYRTDDNADPAERRLQPREGKYKQQKAWEGVERRLQRILSAAVADLELDEDRRRVYEASATEQEIRHGALGIGAAEDLAFCFVRKLVGEPPDPDKAKEDDPILACVDRDQTPLEELKGDLEDELRGRYREYEAKWDEEAGRPATDLDRLATEVREALEAAIERELTDPTEPPGAEMRKRRIEPHEALDAEGEAHRDFADERIRYFVGREGPLAQIGEYLLASDTNPLVLHGGGGTGKSALLAQAVRKAQDSGLLDAQLVYRFIGSTPTSADGRGLLEGICRELARRYGADQSEVPSDFQELSRDFGERLAAASAERPLLLFIDSLDQLAPTHGARRLTWIPLELPEHVRLVVSTRPEDTLDQLRQRLEDVEGRLLEVGPLEPEEGDKLRHADELLGLWLADAGRTEDARRKLTEEQREAVLAAFDRAGRNVLYLRLAFEEARRWTSDQKPEELHPTAEEKVPRSEAVAAIIAGNTFARLADEQNHGETLVSHALGYLAASRHGLSEDELLDLLSRDPDVYRSFLLGSYHVPLDLRERLEKEWLSEEQRSELREAARAEAERRGERPWDEYAEWVRQFREAEQADVPEGERPEDELDRFLAEILPRRGGGGLRLPVVLWSRLYSDLRPYLAERSFEDAVLIDFYHRELGEVADRTYLDGKPAGGDGAAPTRGSTLHGRIADYFLPEEEEEDGRRRWADATRHALSELPFHLTKAGEERWGDLETTLTDFDFLETKAREVGQVTVRDAGGNEVTTYTGVQLLQDDFDRAVREMSGGEEAGRPRIIVTAVDLGEGLVVRCPHCNTVHELTAERRKNWLGDEIACPNEQCKGPLKVNEFVVERSS